MKEKKAIKEYLQSISKDRVVELCLQYQFDAEISEQQFAEKDIRIAELEKEIAYIKKNAIVPKFKVGQKIWYIDRYGIQKDTIISFTYFSIQNEILYKMGDEIIDYREEYIFATEQEAQAKLKELRND